MTEKKQQAGILVLIIPIIFIIMSLVTALSIKVMTNTNIMYDDIEESKAEELAYAGYNFAYAYIEKNLKDFTGESTTPEYYEIEIPYNVEGNTETANIEINRKGTDSIVEVDIRSEVTFNGKTAVFEDSVGPFVEPRYYNSTEEFATLIGKDYSAGDRDYFFDVRKFVDDNREYHEALSIRPTTPQSEILEKTQQSIDNGYYIIGYKDNNIGDSAKYIPMIFNQDFIIDTKGHDIFLIADSWHFIDSDIIAEGGGNIYMYAIYTDPSTVLHSKEPFNIEYTYAYHPDEDGYRTPDDGSITFISSSIQDSRLVLSNGIDNFYGYFFLPNGGITISCGYESSFAENPDAVLSGRVITEEVVTDLTDIGFSILPREAITPNDERQVLAEWPGDLEYIQLKY